MIRIKRTDIKNADMLMQIKIFAYNNELKKYFGDNADIVDGEEILSEHYIINNYLSYEIIIDRKVVGSFFLDQEDNSTMRISDFVIHPSYQGKGYGYRVLCLIEGLYPEITEWTLSTPIYSIGNQHLYEKFGFIERSRNDDEIEYVKINKGMEAM